MKTKIFLSLLLAISTLALSPYVSAADQCDAQVMTAQGPVVGFADPQAPVCAYKGIPYAAPPIADLRWRPPQPAIQRDRVLEAFEFGFRCVSDGSGSGAPKSMLPKADEDCLNLNVWRPQKSGPFPVMVWIHGGSLTVGAAAEPLYFGERLAAAQDVVVVSINYRLNYYGFLAHSALTREDDNQSSGNYGLLDQVAALEWVQENIENFDGDPDNVTIFGESAGGWSVCNLLACPLAKDLFHKAVIESGGCDTVKTLEAGEKDGRKFAKDLGCKGDDALSCMRSMTPKQIEKALEKAGKKKKREQKKPAKQETAGEEKGIDITSLMSFTWVPKIDGHALLQKPIDAIKAGEYNRVPLMVGSNRDEVKLFTIMVPGIRLAPKSLVSMFLVSVLGEEPAKKVEELYPYEDYRRPADAAIDAFGDMALGCKCYDAAAAASEHEPVYYYRFDWDDHMLSHLVGAAHGVEIPFVFDNMDKPPVSWLSTRCQAKKASELVDDTMSYWGNFARTGNPNQSGLVEWPEYDNTGRQRIYLDLPVRAMPTDNKEKCEFWAEQNMDLTGE